MNIDKRTSLIRYSSILLGILFIPLAFYQFQLGEMLEVLRSIGYLSGSIAFAIGPQAFVALPGESKTAVSKLSLSQKCLFLAAIVLALVPFLAFYINGLMNLV